MTIPAGCTIIGSGYGTKIYTTSNITIFTSSGNYVNFQDIRLCGNNSGSQKGISLSGNKCLVSRVWIHDMGGEGLGCSGDEFGLSESFIYNCDSHCVSLSGDHARIMGNYVNDAGASGILLTGSIGCSIIGNQSSDHGDSGIYLVSSSQNLIQGNYCFSNGDNNTNGDGVRIATGSNDNCINGNIFHTNDGYGINISDETFRNIAIGNSCLNNEDGSILCGGVGEIIVHNVE